MSAPEPRWGRRRLLQTGAVALGGAGTGWSAAALGLSDRRATPSEQAGATSAPPTLSRTVAFHGPHQAGIATPPQAYVAVLGMDLLESGRDALGRLMRLLSDDIARLSRGLPALADTEAELAVAPASLTATFGFGPRLMELLAPGTLAPLPAFSTDRLDEAWGQTDVAVQICADDPITLAHARRMLLKDSVGLARLVWVQEGFRRAAGTEPDGTTMRNLMGQVDGTVNPAEADSTFGGLVWSDSEPMRGGSFMILRRIRMLLETWDAVDRSGREAVVGRRLDTGAPLTGTREHDVPDLEATNDFGLPVIDPASHMARARSDDPQQQFLRRGYNYVVPDPSRPTGEDSGLLFVAFAADIDKQFVPVQERLAELDRLNEWVTTIGSAVYAVPPGAADGEYVGQGLVES